MLVVLSFFSSSFWVVISFVFLCFPVLSLKQGFEGWLKIPLFFMVSLFFMFSCCVFLFLMFSSFFYIYILFFFWWNLFFIFLFVSFCFFLLSHIFLNVPFFLPFQLFSASSHFLSHFSSPLVFAVPLLGLFVSVVPIVFLPFLLCPIFHFLIFFDVSSFVLSCFPFAPPQSPLFSALFQSVSQCLFSRFPSTFFLLFPFSLFSCLTISQCFYPFSLSCFFMKTLAHVSTFSPLSLFCFSEFSFFTTFSSFSLVSSVSPLISLFLSFCNLFP